MLVWYPDPRNRHLTSDGAGDLLIGEAMNQNLRSQEDRAVAAGHSIVIGGNLTGHVLHAPGCEACEDEQEQKTQPTWLQRLQPKDLTGQVTS